MDSSRPQSITLSVLGIDAIPVGTKANTMAGSITKQIIYHPCAPNYAHKPSAGQPFQIENTEPLRNRINVLRQNCQVIFDKYYRPIYIKSNVGTPCHKQHSVYPGNETSKKLIT